jgi:hypothetical protein
MAAKVSTPATQKAKNQSALFPHLGGLFKTGFSSSSDIIDAPFFLSRLLHFSGASGCPPATALLMGLGLRGAALAPDAPGVMSFRRSGVTPSSGR